MLIFQIVLGLLAAAISVIAANKINTWPFVSVYWLILSIYWFTMANKRKNADDRERSTLLGNNNIKLNFVDWDHWNNHYSDLANT